MQIDGCVATEGMYLLVELFLCGGTMLVWLLL